MRKILMRALWVAVTAALILPIPVALMMLNTTAGTTVAAPGDADDPIITQSYLDKQFLPGIYEYIDNKLSTFTVPDPATFDESERNKSAQPALAVVTLKQGQAAIGKAGTQMILRQGRASAVATDRGGVADVTLGYDVMHGKQVYANSLIIIPMDDGRGIYAETDTILLIIGQYDIVK